MSVRSFLMSNDFDQSDAWFDLTQRWIYPAEKKEFAKKVRGRKKERTKAKEAFDSLIDTKEKYKILLEQVEEALSETDFSKTPLDILIEEASGFFKETVKKKQQPLPAIKNTLPKKQAVDPDFEALFEDWPINPEFRPHKREAKENWKSLLKEESKEEVNAVCDYYCDYVRDVRNKIASPLNMHVFIRPDDDFGIFRDWQYRKKNDLSPEEKELFNKTYDTYPEFKNKDSKYRENMLLWRRIENKTLFLYCCKAYAKERKKELEEDPEAQKYTLSFANFLTECKSYQLAAANMIGYEYSRPIYRALKKEGLDSGVGLWVCYNIAFLIDKKGMTVKEALLETAKKRGLKNLTSLQELVII